MGKDKKEKERQIAELKNDVKTLKKKKARNNGQESDRHKHYSKRNCPLIHGLKENEKENTDKVITAILETEMQKQVVNQ